MTPEIEAANAESAYWYALGKDTPAKLWWNSSLDHAPIYRALRIPEGTEFAAYALAPFRVAKNEDDQWRVLAAYPCPRVLGEPDPDWLSIEAVIEWNPLDDTARVLGDVAPQLVGSFHDDADEIHGSPRRFFQSWAARRAQFMSRRTGMTAHFTIPPAERDETPGVLAIGQIDQIRWHQFHLPASPACVGIDATAVNKAILRQANLPRAIPASENLKAVA